MIPRPLFVAVLLPAVAMGLPLPRADRHGDAMPVGAVARLGTVQLRGGYGSVHFSADGKTIINVDSSLVREWDAITGKLLRVRRLQGDSFPRHQPSLDGRTQLAFGTRTMVAFDTATGERLALRMPDNLEEVVRAVISDDRRHVVFSVYYGIRKRDMGGGRTRVDSVWRLVSWETATGTLRVLSDDVGDNCRLTLSPDGQRAATSGSSGITLWDITDGKKVWEVKEYGAEQLRFTSDGKRIVACPGRGHSEWKVWEAATGKPAAGWTPPDYGHWCSFALSPDGTKLCVPHEGDYAVWDLQAGREVRRWLGPPHFGSPAFAPDGRSVVTCDTVIRHVDLATGKNLFRDALPLGHVSPVSHVFFTPESRVVTVAKDRTGRVWDFEGRPNRTLAVGGLENDVLTRVGNTLQFIDTNMTVRRVPLDGSAPTRLRLRHDREAEFSVASRDLRVAPDGSLVVLADHINASSTFSQLWFSTWDATTGRLRRWNRVPGLSFNATQSRMSPDGRRVASAVALFDTRHDDDRPLPASPFGIGGVPVFSPDGKLIACGDGPIRVWEAATAKTLLDLPRDAGNTHQGAFSPDGRRLAVVDGTRLAVWDLPTGKRLLHKLPSFVNDVSITSTLAFSPDGRRVATGHSDGTVLLWDVPPAVAEEAVEVASLIDDLDKPSPTEAYAAVWQLAMAGDAVVTALAARHPLVSVAKPGEVAAHIADLDAPRFAVREAASKRLRELGRSIRPAMQAALAAKPTPEQARHLETLLAELDPYPSKPQSPDLRALRSVAVLEAINTPAARTLLREWSERGAYPRLADEAEQAVRRLSE